MNEQTITVDDALNVGIHGAGVSARLKLAPAQALAVSDALRQFAVKALRPVHGRSSFPRNSAPYRYVEAVTNQNDLGAL